MVRIYLGKIGAAAVCCVGVWGLADPGNFGWPGSAGKTRKSHNETARRRQGGKDVLLINREGIFQGKNRMGIT
jgi:hypothetical protein